VRLFEAAKLMGLSGKTLKRAVGQNLLAPTRDGDGHLIYSPEDLLHAPLYSQKRSARLLGIKYMQLNKLALDMEGEVPFEYRGLRRIRYFSLAAIRALGRKSETPGRIKVACSSDDRRWSEGRLITYPGNRHLRVTFDALNSNE
jgi:hypothetical protein